MSRRRQSQEETGIPHQRLAGWPTPPQFPSCDCDAVHPYLIRNLRERHACCDADLTAHRRTRQSASCDGTSSELLGSHVDNVSASGTVANPPDAPQLTKLLHTCDKANIDGRR